MKRILSGIVALLALLLFPAAAFAHVIVTPAQVGIASRQVFTMSVPTEKDTPTVGLRLLIPSGLKEVTPDVKPGWTIDVKKSGDDVTEIDWTGGSIPPDQRDEFLFQAQAPAKATTLQWKAYQTYSDGSITAWDHAPTSNPEDDSAPPPYSQTKVVNDITQPSVQSDSDTPTRGRNTNTVLSTMAFILSIVALSIALRKR